jgi:glutamate dehydrogenase
LRPGPQGSIEREARVPSRFDEDKKRLIAAAGKRVAADPDGEMLSRFTELLFAHGAGEDIVEYDAHTLATTSRDAFAFFRSRSVPTAVRVGDVPGIDARGRSHTAIELSTANRPFIFDSVLGELQALGHMARLVVHPIVEVARNAAGEVVSFGPARGEAADGRQRESFVHVHVPLIRDEAAKVGLVENLTKLLQEVERATDDWRAMRVRLHSAITAFSVDHPTLADAVTDETIAFLQWLEEDNFVFLGMREYAYSGSGDLLAEVSKGEGLGLLRDPEVSVLRPGDEAVTMTPEIRAFLVANDPIIVTKANVKSRVHRRDYMDYVGVKIFEGGEVTGELRIVGLFTSTAFTRSVARIPLIRRRVAETVEQAGFDPLSHSGKALLNILEHYPRTELFQADTRSLLESALAILQLEERPRVRVLPRRDRFDRFVSVLVFAPRDRYTSDLRERIGDALAEMYDGRVSTFFPDFSMTHLTRVQFIVGRNPGEGPDPAQEELEVRVRAIVRNFDDDVTEALNAAFSPERAADLQRDYAEAFAPDYRAAFAAKDALRDMEIAERLTPEDIEVRFFRGAATPDTWLVMSFHHLGDPIPLSRRVPLLECLGFSVIDERTYRIARADGPNLYRHDMTLVRADGHPFEVDAAERLRHAVLAVWRDKTESDDFNTLVLTAALPWRSAALLRTVARYLRQTDLPYSLDYLAGALKSYPAIAALMTERFAARFDPATKGREKVEQRIQKEFEAALEAVASLDDDTILRAFNQVIEATQRTDFFAAAPGEEPAAVTLKIKPEALSFVPLPRPFREIFVHSPEVEGVHLRFGPVARGGLRWSDRPQDFRTEVLGLVKAQQVKNAVIVPVGAKGGFVPQRLPAAASRDVVFEAGRRAYIAFVDRLLSVTDDIEGDAVVPPKDVVVHDGEDAYLVVAADKGTATFSDTANGISLERGFWLGDAFASGGSAGYDHKVMGITARGAWEAVKRHFREMDVDIQTQPFTTVGVGDMSGDVFGNGMLLSHTTKLVAAFDHRDIFIDPTPNPETSFGERKRLFDLPRSSWQEYDRALISKGGGVFSRAQKEIALSPEIRKALKFNKTRVRPAELLMAILKAPVDLLWFGGIGTYVRGLAETNAEVGDKANDAIRIAASEVGAKVVGEGANLGMTPKARIAYGLKGGRCNSDAIDNSAGVNTSDVEVNIKIALAPAVRGGRLSEGDRLALLRDMTGDVAGLVLRNNYQQTLAISLEALRGQDNLGNQMRLMAELEERGLLDREVEDLPQDSVLEERAAAGHGLTRAEIGTLLAFAKIALFNDLVDSPVPDDPYLARELFRYFPLEMRERFASEIEGHRLRREIIATQLSNSVINRGGPTLLVAARDRTGGSPADLTRAYAAVRDSFAIQDLHADIDALDTKISGQLQLKLYATAHDVLVDRLAWFGSNLDPTAGLAEIVAHYRAALDELARALPSLLSRELAKAMRDTAQRLKTGRVPEVLAARLALLPNLARASDVVLIADRTGRSLADAAQSFFAISERFGFGYIDAMTHEVETNEYYEGLALQKARDSLETAHRDLASSLIANGGAIDVAAWEAASGERITATALQVERILSDRRPSMAKVSVAASLLSELARG